MALISFNDLGRSSISSAGLGTVLRYPYQLALKSRENWRRRQTQKMIESLDPEIRKDIGWPTSFTADGK